MGADEKHAATCHGLSDDTVRGRYCDGTHAQTGHTTDGAEYDAWLAGVKAEAKAEALEEAAEALDNDQSAEPGTMKYVHNIIYSVWLTERANQYKEEPANGR